MGKPKPKGVILALAAIDGCGIGSAWACVLLMGLTRMLRLGWWCRACGFNHIHRDCVRAAMTVNNHQLVRPSQDAGRPAVKAFQISGRGVLTEEQEFCFPVLGRDVGRVSWRWSGRCRLHGNYGLSKGGEERQRGGGVCGGLHWSGSLRSSP